MDGSPVGDLAEDASMTGAVRSHLIWTLVGFVGAFALAAAALQRGEHVNALWIVVASIAVYAIAYRYQESCHGGSIGSDPIRPFEPGSTP
jgi:hypothetical protein